MRRHSLQGGGGGGNWLGPGPAGGLDGDIDSESDTMSRSSEEAEDAELLGGRAQPDTWLALQQECWKCVAAANLRPTRCTAA